MTISPHLVFRQDNVFIRDAAILDQYVFALAAD